MRADIVPVELFPDYEQSDHTGAKCNPRIPNTVVLEPGLVVFKILTGYWYFGWPTVEDVRQDSRAVSRKCRPDWDISSSEVNAAWERGGKSRFYLFGKGCAKVFGEQE